MLNIYFAAPLFNEIERKFNYDLERKLSKIANVFLPQRDGKLLEDLIKNGTPAYIARKEVYQRDIEAIRSSDIVVAILDGRTIDEGVAFELGFGKALGLKCLGLKTDVRTLLSSGDNPMITEGCDTIYTSFEKLYDHIKSLENRRLEFIKYA